jgi:hypothetical protein
MRLILLLYKADAAHTSALPRWCGSYFCFTKVMRLIILLYKADAAHTSASQSWCGSYFWFTKLMRIIFILYQADASHTSALPSWCGSYFCFTKLMQLIFLPNQADAAPYDFACVIFMKTYMFTTFLITILLLHTGSSLNGRHSGLGKQQYVTKSRRSGNTPAYRLLL